MGPFINYVRERGGGVGGQNDSEFKQTGVNREANAQIRSLFHGKNEENGRKNGGKRRRKNERKIMEKRVPGRELIPVS
jgi:hypothetical protein